jgi:tetratricopeptide (TPR) repeat protein
MQKPVKLIAYGVLVACTLGLGLAFYKDVQRSDAPPVPNPATNVGGTGPSEVPTAATHQSGRSVGLLALFILSAMGLAVMVAYDLSHLVATRFQTFLFEVDEEVEKDPDYEEAEKAWADGRHLDAVGLLREFLKHKPRAIYAARRIAEIYEKDLGNHLAAALEYEEILKHPIPAEHWGWAAIHLANLYSGRLNKPEQAEALLRRILAEHPHTAAAHKARQRLGEPEPTEEPPPEETAPPDAPPEEPPPKSNLPPGFRPK